MSDNDARIQRRIEVETPYAETERRRAPAPPLPDPPLFGRRAAGIGSAFVIAAVLFPIAQNWRDRPVDSFPLSYYPMFTLDRPDVVRVDYLVGVDASGARQNLDYKLAGSGGYNQVRRQIRRTVSRDRAQDLCDDVAADIADDTAFEDIGTVQVVSGHFSMDAYFGGNKAPARDEVHASATVKRGGP